MKKYFDPNQSIFLGETDCDGMEWNDLVHASDQCRALVSKVMNLIVGFCILLRVYPLMLFLKTTVRTIKSRKKKHLLRTVMNIGIP
jgi:hypothetical protein